MNPDVVEKFDKYMNEILSNYLGYSDYYEIQLDILGDEYQISMISQSEYSPISTIYLSDDPQDQIMILNFEREIIKFIRSKFLNVDEKSVSINYDYDSIVVTFKNKK
jgi:hypothetical protein